MEFVVADDGAVEIELIRRVDRTAVLAEIRFDAVGEDADEHLTHRGLVQALVALALLEDQMAAHLALSVDTQHAVLVGDGGVGLLCGVILGVLGIGDEHFAVCLGHIARGDNLYLVLFAVNSLFADDGDHISFFRSFVHQYSSMLMCST